MSKNAYVIVEGGGPETEGLVVVEQILAGSQTADLYGYYLDDDAPGTKPDDFDELEALTKPDDPKKKT